MNTDPEQMRLRTGESIAIGRAMVCDHAFRFALHADVYPKQGTDVYGVLWEIDDDALKALDGREGYPYYYDRKIVTVESSGQLYKAWMYYMTPGHPAREPSHGYYSMLVRGYTIFNVPMKQIEDALELSKSAPGSTMEERAYRINRDIIAYQSVGYSRWSSRPTRWFDSYTELVKFTHGRKMLRRIAAEAAQCGLSTEQMASDFVNYDEITVPDHFRVREDSVAARTVDQIMNH
jgi:gamma-glutamylcyclotransferase (GGCT)/AIG2-like uncharacterized protein YtfP